MFQKTLGFAGALLVVFLFGGPQLTFAQNLAFRTADGVYRSGPEWVTLLQQNMCPEAEEPCLSPALQSFLRPGLYGFLRVPLDYSNPAAGEMDIFYRTSRPLDLSKPTVFFLNGGPGGTAQDYELENGLEDWNWIYMDHRGTGLSKPALWEQLTNPGFFSSEFVARDMLKVLEALQIPKAAIYGHSYGTVVGTIFASKFPDRTMSLVLEGTIKEGGTGLWSAPYRVAILNHFLRSLPESLRQAVIDRTSLVPGLPPEWFSKMAQRAMYSPKFKAAFRTKLEQFVELSPQEALANYQFSFPDGDDGMLVEHYTAGPLFAHHILCQELSAHVPAGSFDAIFQNGRLVASSQESLASGCQLIETHPRFKKKIFRSQDYPLRVPVTYLQGMMDGATPYMEALHHFQGATGTRRQMVLVIEGGHSPVVQCLQEESPQATCPAPDTLSDLLSRAFMGESLSSERVDALGSKWKFTGRRADGTKYR